MGIYGRNVGSKVRDIFPNFLIDFVQGSDLVIKFLVASMSHWGGKGVGEFTYKRG
jgi:hypothetical protein